MFFWMQFPFLRIALFFILGIFCASYGSGEWSASLGIFIIFIIGFLTINILFKDKRTNFLQNFSGFLFFGAVFSFGFTHFQIYKNANKPDKLLDSKFQFYSALVIENSEQKGKNFRTIVEAVQLYKDNKWQKVSGKIILYHSSGTAESSFNYGDLLLIKGKPYAVPGPSNPEEFDYSTYLQNQNIYFQHFLKTDELQLVKKGAVKDISYYIKRLRKKAVGVFEEHINEHQERAIALALVLGVKNELDDEIKQAYAASGAMHVLAVSGLHVGMIYGIILLIFGKIRKVKGGNFIFAIIALCLLWIYAGITGLPASVLRAVTMLSVIILSRIKNRQTNIYNSLAIAAVLLLIYNPLFLFSVGFQLSFLAVTGIIYLFPWLYHLIIPEHIILDKIWALCCISFAAQLATFPLSLHYFNQFPVYFFLTNLVVIPAAFVILSTGLLLIFVGLLTQLEFVLAFILENTIWIVNKTIFSLEFLPHHTITGLYINSFQTFLLYAFIFLFVYFLHQKKFEGLVASFFTVFLYFIISINVLMEQKLQKKIVFYKVQKNSAIDFIQGFNVISYIDDGLIDDPSKIMYHIAPYRLSRGLNQWGNGNVKINDGQNIPAYNSRNGVEFIVWNGKKVIIISKPLEDIAVNFEKLETDYLVLRNRKPISLQTILSSFTFKMLILDASYNLQLASKIEEEAKELNISCHSLNKDGVLVIDFDY